MREFINIVENVDRPGEDRLIEGPFIDGRIVPRLPDGSAPHTLYRIMSRAEYRSGEHRGAFMSRDGRVHADIRPHFEYCEPGPENVLVRIDYRDEDGWKAKMSGLGVVAITDVPIPAERMHVIASGTRRDLERAMSRITENVLLERSIPPTDWGYWITDQGEYLPVKSHRHADTVRSYFVSRNLDLRNSGIESESAIKQGWIWVKATPGNFFIVLMKRGAPSRRAISALSRLARSADYFEYWLHFENEGGKQEFIDAGEFLRAITAGNRLDERPLNEGRVHEIDTGYRGIVRMTRVYENPSAAQAETLARASTLSGLLYLRGILYRGRTVFVGQGSSLTHHDLVQNFLPQLNINDSEIVPFEVANYVMRSPTPTITSVHLRGVLMNDELSGSPAIARLLTGCRKAVDEKPLITENGYVDILERALWEDVWHGSPHEFDKFSTDNIGSGEGVQAYGWGLYFTGTKKIAEYYRNELTKIPEVELLGHPVRIYLVSGYGSQSYVDQLRDEVARRAKLSDLKPASTVFVLRQIYFYMDADKRSIADATKHFMGVLKLSMMDAERAGEQHNVELIQTYLTIAPVIASLLKHKNPGRLYQVEIPEPDTYLLWDEPLERQPARVKTALGEIEFLATSLKPEMLGASIYQELARLFRMMVSYRGLDTAMTNEIRGNPQKAASLELLRHGVHGIKYLDGNSRDDNEGSYNYVLFDAALARVKGSA